VQALGHGPPRAAWIAAAAFLLLLLPRIGTGTLWHHDELLTANRAREMLVRGDPFAVTLNFAPSVKKPPLQFWICALLLRALPGQPEFAVRLPTLLAGAACLLAAAWLAQLCGAAGDHSPATWTALALAGCGYLIHDSRLALLDPGAALFLTLALAGWQLAQRDARWWWFVALQCILGAWQKAPYGLAAWVLLLVARRLPGAGRKVPTPAPVEARRVWRYQQAAAFAAAVIGALGWWSIEWMRADRALLVTAGYEQTSMFLRAHDPADTGIRPWVYWGWLARDWALPGIFAPAAAVAAVLAWRQERRLGELGLVGLVFGGITASLVYRSERYLVLITPLLALLTVHGLERVQGRLPAAASRWLLSLVLATTLPVAAFHYFKPSPSRPDLLAVSRALGRSLRPDERILVSTDAESGFDLPEFVLFYANLRRAVEAVPLQTMEDLPAQAGPCRGICGRAQWPKLRRAQPTLHLVAACGVWILWAGAN
jgi:4-amino-4-deoxy-L-arabinose transferase-like glycosyltransferase